MKLFAFLSALARAFTPKARPAPVILAEQIPPFARGRRPWTVYGPDGSTLGTVWLSPRMTAEDVRWFLEDPHTGPADVTVVEGVHK